MAARPHGRRPGRARDTVAEMREQDSADRLMVLATVDGTVVGSGVADRSDTTGGGFVAPRVLPDHRRRGVGTALLAVTGRAHRDPGPARAEVDGRGHRVAGVRGALRVRRGRPAGRAGADRRRRAAAVAASRRRRGHHPRPGAGAVAGLLRDVRHRGAGGLRRVRAAGDLRRAVGHLLGRRPDVPGSVRRRGDRLRRASTATPTGRSGARTPSRPYVVPGAAAASPRT